MTAEATSEELWRGLLTGEGSSIERLRRRYKRFPGQPKCTSCLVPLSGPVARVIQLFSDVAPSGMNPKFCNMCETFVRTHPGGAEIELTLLFADTRGSTPLAERTSAGEFTQPLNRFYGAADRVLMDSDAPIQVRVLRVGTGRAESVEQSAVASL